MTPDDVDALLRRFSVPPAPAAVRERVLEEARRIVVRQGPQPQPSRWSRRTAIAASLLVGVAVFWAMVFPPEGIDVKPAQDRTDPSGDALPPGTLQRFGSIRFRHPGRTTHGGALLALAVSPDEKKLASA